MSLGSPITMPTGLFLNSAYFNALEWLSSFSEPPKREEMIGYNLIVEALSLKFEVVEPPNWALCRKECPD